MEFPKMIYLGGDLAAEWRIVDDAKCEAEAAKDGFFAYDKKPAAKAETAPAAADEPVKERKKPGPKPKAAQ
jgi:hypothetical protein